MNRPIRIIVLFGNVPLLGQERGTIDVLDSLQRNGAEVLFLIRDEWTKNTIQAELRRRGLPFETVPYFDSLRKGYGPMVWIRNLTGILGGSWNLLRWHRKFKPSHIHVSSVSNIVNFMPALLLLRTPIVFRAGDDMTLHHWLWRLIWRFTVWRTNRFAAISRYIIERLKINGVPKEKISLVSNIAPPRTTETFDENKITFTRNNDKFTFVYVGQLTLQKGIDVLVNAAISYCKKSEKCHFFIAGDFSWENNLAVQLLNAVEHAGLSDRIVFTGYTRHIHELLFVCDVHICPSVGPEAYGNVVIEAKQEGLPSIIFPTGGLSELVEHGVDGWVCESKSENDLLDAFSYYESHPDVGTKQGVVARASLTRLGNENFDTDWLGIYGKT